MFEYIRIMEIQAGPLLSKIEFPSDLKKIKKEDLVQLCNELRQFIIDSVSVNGGHFAASLGVVELTVALHYVYNTPYDKLVWDVGHQAYGHKILTGRRAQFHTNRKYKGLSGFPKMSESEYDAFGVGHSSTSISAALGMAIASKLKEEHNRMHVAIIGDGAMTAGLPFEALQHVGSSDTDILIILNDNNISIDPNVGSLKEYLTDITTSKTYNKARNDVWKILGKLPGGTFNQQVASKIEASLKGVVSKNSNLFEALGLRYFGQVDGHNILKLVEIFKDLKEIKGPKILHINTVKGKGFEKAEKDQTLWHAPGTFDKTTGVINKVIFDVPQPPKYQDVFGKTIIELAKANEKVMGVTPAMPSGCSMKYMIQEMPKRAFDVGICEQHAVTLSAGLATQGMKVFCNIYSSFMQRAYDQVIHDVAIQKLPVIFCLDRAGLVGDDGPTHHGVYDIAYMRCIPNMVIAAPMNEVELRNMMFTAQSDSNHSPYVIRYPRGEGVMSDWEKPFELIETGKGQVVKEGNDIAVLSIGHPGNFVVEACQKLENFDLDIAHYNMRFVKPIDEGLLHTIAQKFKQIITVEDGCIMGGFGSACLEFFATHQYKIEVTMLGIPDRLVEHGKPAELHKECGYDSDAIAMTIKNILLDKKNIMSTI
ncbi:MAG: 1-deoxy-D-xylulose-5-phosphate synthase [Bacteroidetes bacterium OLB11]|nr:MAG: 1-deoxy-D-xylulose-5-phosphate synthase [Bacteroidetes bacterium OLB11]